MVNINNCVTIVYAATDVIYRSKDLSHDGHDHTSSFVGAAPYRAM